MQPKLELKPPKEGGRSPFFYIRGSYLGTSVDRSTRTADPIVAARELKKVKRDIERGRYRESPTRAAKDGFLTAVDRYLDFKKALALHNRKFIRTLTLAIGDMPVAEIDQAFIDRLAVRLYPEAGPATRNRNVYTPISAILRHFGVPLAMRRPEGAQGNKREAFLLPEEVDALFDAAWRVHPRFAALCTFLVYTGCRVSEGTTLHARAVDLTTGYARLGKTKNGKPRGVHLPPIVVAAIRVAGHTDGKVFGLTRGGRLYNLLNECVAVANTREDGSAIVPPRVEIPEGVSFHIFRHTYGAWMRRYGGVTRLEETGVWLSRAGASTYDHYDVSETARRADLLPGAGRVEARLRSA